MPHCVKFLGMNKVLEFWFLFAYVSHAWSFSTLHRTDDLTQRTSGQLHLPIRVPASLSYQNNTGTAQRTSVALLEADGQSEKTPSKSPVDYVNFLIQYSLIYGSDNSAGARALACSGAIDGDCWSLPRARHAIMQSRGPAQPASTITLAINK